jgi:hypothetical protein
VLKFPEAVRLGLSVLSGSRPLTGVVRSSDLSALVSPFCAAPLASGFRGSSTRGPAIKVGTSTSSEAGAAVEDAARAKLSKESPSGGMVAERARTKASGLPFSIGGRVALEERAAKLAGDELFCDTPKGAGVAFDLTGVGSSFLGSSFLGRAGGGSSWVGKIRVGPLGTVAILTLSARLGCTPKVDPPRATGRSASLAGASCGSAFFKALAALGASLAAPARGDSFFASTGAERPKTEDEAALVGGDILGGFMLVGFGNMLGRLALSASGSVIEGAVPPSPPMLSSVLSGSGGDTSIVEEGSN